VIAVSFRLGVAFAVEARGLGPALVWSLADAC